jgi:hypothetical protein
MYVDVLYKDYKVRLTTISTMEFYAHPDFC